jgi:broad-specificity NMP kinase
MIIEFTGIPGSGKSTVFNKINNDNLIKDIKKFFIKTNNTFLFDLYLVFNFYRLDKNDYKILKFSIKNIKQMRISVFNKINLLRNIYKKLIIYKLLRERPENFLIDEGVIHLLFNVFVGKNIATNKSEIEDFIKILPKPEKLIIIDANDKIIYERLKERGHKRVNTTNENELKEFLKQSRNVIETIKKYFDSYYVYINEGKIKINEITEYINKI